MDDFKISWEHLVSLLCDLCSVLQTSLIKHLLPGTWSCYISLSLCEFLPYTLFTSV